MAEVHYTEGESKEIQLEGYKDVETIESKASLADWGEQVKVCQSCDGYQQDTIKMLIEFDKMWDVRLGQIGIVKHIFELNSPNLQPINSALYRAGPEARELKRWNPTICLE